MARASKTLPVLTPPIRGEVELVCGADHFLRVIRDGLLKAKTSLDIATADFKAMLVPIVGPASSRSHVEPIVGPASCRSGVGPASCRSRRAISIVQVFRRLARNGIEIRLLHSGVPSGPALRELKRELPERITIRRCPRLHAKIVIVDCAWMYLGSANLTGAGLGAKSPRRRNFEMGICTQALPLIDATLEQFNAIWEGHRCENCGRRNVCPVPLEEPQL